MRNNPCYKCEENKNCTHLDINKKCINPDGSIRLLRLMDRIEFEHKGEENLEYEDYFNHYNDLKREN